MADYTQGTGSGGVMLIRDHGWAVEFFIQAGHSTTFANGKSWSWAANGTGGSGVFNYPQGRGWLHLGTINVGTTQTIRFSIGATGTSGLGGPTDFWLTLNRATVPQAPTPIGLDQITHTSMRYRFSGNGNGGAAIIEWQIAYGTDPNSGQFHPISTGTSTLTGLKVGTGYYFWSRGRNAVGWGPWSARIYAKTLAGSRVKVAGVWRDAVPYVRVAGVWKPAIPYVKVGTTWKVGV